MSVTLSLTVNGKRSPRTSTRARCWSISCATTSASPARTSAATPAQCGACTVHLDGNAVKACNDARRAGATARRSLTIEGLAAADGTMHPMQAAFKECHGLQCGFCTPGMVMSAIDLVNRHPKADEQTIREELEGNFCRCTGYHNIVKAVQQGAAAMGK